MFYLLLTSLLSLIYIYGGYYHLLKLLSKVFSKKRFYLKNTVNFQTGVTVYFPVFNEESRVLNRLDNIISSDYPVELLEIVVISDGSTDCTSFLVNKFIKTHDTYDIKLIDLDTNRGQAYIQNLIVKKSKYNILVSTDADSIFEPTTIMRLIQPFYDNTVGVVGGVVKYIGSSNSDISAGYSKYRDLENRIRNYEMQLGVLCKTDGPCTAYRTSIWSTIEDFEDVDQVITILATNANLKSVQVTDAICFDKANHTSKQDTQQRSRMTRKALLSTFNRLTFSSFLSHPLFWFALISHKVFRFFSPLFLLLFSITICYYMLILSKLFIIGCFLTVITIITLVKRGKIHNKYMSFFVAFLTAQRGFALGIVGWLRGDRSGRYIPTRKQR